MKKSTCILTSLLILTVTFLPGMASSIWAKDTDIYTIESKNNAVMFIDSSNSMAYTPVYENSINYANFHCAVTGCDDPEDPDFYFKRDRIYMVTIPAKVFTQTGSDGTVLSTTGDAGAPDLWQDGTTATGIKTWFDTGTEINDSEELSGGHLNDVNGQVTLDGTILANGQSINLHDYTTLEDGTQLDQGFIGMLKAPGYYYSGFKDVSTNLDSNGELLNYTPTAADTSSNGTLTQNTVFFATGNWLNMVRHYDDLAGETYDLSTKDDEWIEQDISFMLPNGTGNLTDKIYLPGAAYVQVHISSVTGSFTITDGTTSVTSNSTGWFNTTSTGNLFAGETITIKLNSTEGIPSPAVTIDKVRLVYDEIETAASGNQQSSCTKPLIEDTNCGDFCYAIQSRLDIGKEAMLLIAENFTNINWGFAYLDSNSQASLTSTTNNNPLDNDDLHGNELLNHITTVVGTCSTDKPLGEALQDLPQLAYGTQTSHHVCRKNFIIMVTDGLPSADNDWTRINNGLVDFKIDNDGDSWVQDPADLYPVDPNNDYYDDVANWWYTHSWKEGTAYPEVDDPAASTDNIITHNISFGSRQPMLQDAADEAGGDYIPVYNKTQLLAAFESMAMQISKAVSFTAPVVSVDSANKIQSGNDLYMAVFQPMDGESWLGNIKKFRLGKTCTTDQDTGDQECEWMIYDAADNQAIDSEGVFLENTNGFWGDDLDPNDSDSYGSADVTEDGVGEVLAEQVACNFEIGGGSSTCTDSTYSSNGFFDRNIMTYINGSIISFSHANVSPGDLGFNTTDYTERDRLINYIYGYTYDVSYDANTNDPKPVAVRDWPLGSIIHSQPVLIDYNTGTRYIAIGSNDGMLHVFDDATGQEVFAFIPEDLLTRLYIMSQKDLVDMVDGPITLYMESGSPKYLIFGERRGGQTYWCLDISDSDPANWTVKWSYSPDEMGQSWGKPQISSVPVTFDPISLAATEYRKVLVFTGGYDSLEDGFPEPFEDTDLNGTPFAVSVDPLGSGSTPEEIWTDSIGGISHQYDVFNPGIDTIGRSVYITDLENPNSTIYLNNGTPTNVQILPFTVQYGSSDITIGANQMLKAMKYSFPASPAVVTIPEFTTDENGDFVFNFKMESVYATDIYANVFKITYDIDLSSTPTFNWKVVKLFEDSGNGRKAFYPPAVSWGGTGTYFNVDNYQTTLGTFEGTDKIATIYYGTGDREHPRYTIVENRFYAVFDDSSVTGTTTSGVTTSGVTVNVTGVPYDSANLLDVSTADVYAADTLDLTEANSTSITDDTVTVINNTDVLEDLVNEDDLKGWYIHLENQVTDGSHEGEKILSRPLLFNKIVYFTSYQPPVQDVATTDDSCNLLGSGRTYAVDYFDGSAVYDMNDDSSIEAESDRSKLYEDIYGIPSGFTLIIQDGVAAAIASIGDGYAGGGEGGEEAIKAPAMGLQLYYWKEKN